MSVPYHITFGIVRRLKGDNYATMLCGVEVGVNKVYPLETGRYDLPPQWCSPLSPEDAAEVHRCPECMEHRDLPLTPDELGLLLLRDGEIV